MKKILLYERWRPTKIEDMVLPQRIHDFFKDGLQTNVILYGHYGTGKSTLARILIGKYNKEFPYLEINTSLYSSIEVLRNKIYDFCVSSYVDLENNVDYTDKHKYVYLDEFDGASKQYQDALKGFIEEMSANYGVRFIFVTNHINKVHDGIKSRMTLIPFDCQNKSEAKELKTKMYKRIMNIIAKEENIDITKESLISIINGAFPDFRKTLTLLQDFVTNKPSESLSSNSEKSVNTISLIMDKESTYKSIYDFVLTNFGDSDIQSLLKILGRDFVYYIMNTNLNQETLFEVNDIVVEMEDKLQNSNDPLILGIATIGRIRKLYI